MEVKRACTEMALALWQKGVQSQGLWNETLPTHSGGQEIRFPKGFFFFLNSSSALKAPKSSVHMKIEQ